MKKRISLTNLFPLPLREGRGGSSLPPFVGRAGEGLLLLLLLLLSPCVRGEDVVYLTTEQFKARVFDYSTEREWKYKGDKPCVIDFYTTWCGPCKRLAPIMEELSQTYCDKVVFYKVDTERERELAYAFQIQSIPQVLYVPMEGKPILLKGLYPKESIVQMIEQIMGPTPPLPTKGGSK